MVEDKKQWVDPKATEIEVAERTLNNDGLAFDNMDPEPDPS